MKAFLFALICCSLLTGCGCNANRPSPKNNYYTDYVVSRSYVLKRPVFFSNDKKFQDAFLRRIGEGGSGAVPETLEQFQKNPAAWDVDLVPKGTTLKISGINYTDHFDAGPSIWINAVILDGKMTGKKCLLNWISNRIQRDNPYVRVPMIDTNILELVAKP